MSKFHTTVSRREFMKGLGLAGAGIGAATVAGPSFQDLDAFNAAPEANYREPWWVSLKEHKNPTVEIDWQNFQHWDVGDDANPIQYGYATTDQSIIDGKDKRSQITQEQNDMRSEKLLAGIEGYDLKANALYGAAGVHRIRNFGGEVPWDGPSVTTPEKLGVPKWSGSPEDATKLLRAASHFAGSPKIGITDIDADTKKLFRPKYSRFENTDTPYIEGKVKVIPDSYRTIISFAVRQQINFAKMGGLTAPRNLGPGVRYANIHYIGARIMAFIKGMGYNVLQDWATGSGGNSWGRSNVPHAVMAGLGELSRNGHNMAHEWGTAGIYQGTLVTDMPLAPTNPIDFGGHRFCKTCMTCATDCQAINGQTPLSLEKEPTWETTGPWNRQGIKAFQIMWPLCTTACPICDPVCPFSSLGDMDGNAIVHSVVKVSQKFTPVFNGFFTEMERSFGFDHHWEPEDWEAWWNRDLTKWKYDDIWGTG